MRMPSRRAVVWLSGALVALVIVTLVALAAGRDDDVGASSPLPARPLVIGSVRVAATNSPGDSITARVTLRADRPMTLDNVFVQVRNTARLSDPLDPAKRTLDLRGQNRIRIGDTVQRVTYSEFIYSAGTYRYNLVYDYKGRTYSLPPYGTFVIR